MKWRPGTEFVGLIHVVKPTAMVDEHLARGGSRVTWGMAKTPSASGSHQTASDAQLMRAVVLVEEGGPEVLTLQDVAVPTPGAGEVRVRLARAALNHLDVWIRKGLPSVDKPRIMGAGKICSK